jgi:hypothetical protein
VAEGAGRRRGALRASRRECRVADQCSEGVNLCCRIRDELAFVRPAVFTEPDDSSSWFYHRFLIGQLAAVLLRTAPQIPSSLVRAEPAALGVSFAAWQRVAPSRSAPSVPDIEGVELAVALIEEDLKACRELRGLEEGSEGAASSAGKWPTLAQVTLLQLLRFAPGGLDEEGDAELRSGLEALIVKDPRHASYYKYALRSGGNVLLTSLGCRLS